MATNGEEFPEEIESDHVEDSPFFSILRHIFLGISANASWLMQEISLGASHQLIS